MSTFWYFQDFLLRRRLKGTWFVVAERAWCSGVFDAQMMLWFSELIVIPEIAAVQVKSARSKKAILGMEGILPLPKSPVPGDAFLEPIVDLKGLQRAARELSNCATDFATEVWDGEVYFLRWRGRQDGLVKLSRDGEKCWRFASALGAGNTKLNHKTMRAIKRRLSVVGL